jgi:hypothetical protein
MIARPPNIWEISPFLASLWSSMSLVWGGDQQRLPLAYDVVATIVLYGGRRLRLSRQVAECRLIRIACGASGSSSLFLPRLRRNRRSNEYALCSLVLEVSSSPPPVALRRPTCTVCVNLAAVVCDENCVGFVKPCSVYVRVHTQMMYEHLLDMFDLETFRKEAQWKFKWRRPRRYVCSHDRTNSIDC